ncbi:type I glyceraldehyde-3-phosphate dehydrogenase [Candidatus Nomurabacteria bacterium RIFCSPHIGHO2_01_FULL_38_19]|uniref:Type I glyceraldehyde-3-phosphate dehydrogenase n=1 Tax=Candidatus Nomurabacteria bacterium RIFCSPHIGHO2_01_FULL_38_19 TaxID=1801732 RepID=A0A1F6UQ60_9BACT|nr:MAG: type I glyceraldehyde-3-phosphate dehydrogenase [Candidatus Nomurabacteria bacterium RIFCSPHIGHO2_01_FULL_38_19]
MKTIKVGINGFGRIGRAFLKVAWERPEIEIVAVNDLGSLENIAYLLKYDTVYGQAPFAVEENGAALIISGKEVRFLSEKNPANLPWKQLDIDVVVESTGLFDEYNKAKAHLDAGAKRVVISAPVKTEIEGLGATVLMGLNEDRFGSCPITNNASCTTVSASPIIAILDETLGIEKAMLTTTHAYTATQSIVDSPAPHGGKKSDMRRGRAAAQNIVPSSTGSAIAVTKAYKKLEGKFDGIALRVPVAAGSISDITFVASRNTTVEEVNNILRKAARSERWKGIFDITEEQLVSSDIIGNRHGSIAQLDMTRVVDGNLVKVMGWYDNEMGYTYTLVDHVIKTGNTIK